jgi:hypothetical protein
MLLLPFAVLAAFIVGYESYDAPWINAPSWLTFYGMPVSIASVFVAALLLPVRRLWIRLLIALMLSPLFFWMLWWFGLFLACALGDCI